MLLHKIKINDPISHSYSFANSLSTADEHETATTASTPVTLNSDLTLPVTASSSSQPRISQVKIAYLLQG